jgi:hypothetical protein
LIGLILSAYSPAYHQWIKQISVDFFKEINRLVATRGIKFTVSYVKTSRNAYLRAFTGKPLTSCSGVSLDINGYPKWIIDIFGNTVEPDKVKIILSFLISLRSIQLEPILDTETITAPWKGVDTVTERELVIGLRALGVYKNTGKYLFKGWNSFHLTTKRGPFGQASLSSISEATFLSHTQVEDICLLGGKELASHLENLTDRLDILNWTSVSYWWMRLFPPKNNNLRKLSFFSDKEGKTRVIGIMDYWTQTAMKPLHNLLNKILKNIKADMTFNQDLFTTRIPDLTGTAHSFQSIDLSAATDRMPIALQRRVIEFLVGTEKSLAWQRLMVDTEFLVTLPKGESLRIKYSTGQPMGAYSSWPTMALTHHLIVRVAAIRAGLPGSFSDYFLLGDDLVIFNDNVSSSYKELLSQLDMPYSPDKTHESKDSFEFAKRWFYQGYEITGFAVGGLLATYKRYPLLHGFLKNQSGHGFNLPIERHPDLIRDIFFCLHRNPVLNRIKSMQSLYLIFDSLMDIKINFYDLPEDTVKLFFERIAVIACPKTWLESFPTPKMALKALLLKAKFWLVEKDLYSFQSDAYIVNSMLNTFVDNRIKESGAINPETISFLKETLSVVLNWSNPIVNSLNRLIDKSTDYLCNTVLTTEEEFMPEFIIESGLSKYFVSKGVFSQRASYSIALAESAVIKGMIKVLKGEVTTSLAEPSSIQNYNPQARLVLESGFHLIPRLALRYGTPYIKKGLVVLRPFIYKKLRNLSVATGLMGLITHYSDSLPELVLVLLAVKTLLSTIWVFFLPTEAEDFIPNPLWILFQNLTILLLGGLIVLNFVYWEELINVLNTNYEAWIHGLITYESYFWNLVNYQVSLLGYAYKDLFETPISILTSQLGTHGIASSFILETISGLLFTILWMMFW